MFIIGKDVYNDYVKNEPSQYNIWKILNGLVNLEQIYMKLDRKHLIKQI